MLLRRKMVNLQQILFLATNGEPFATAPAKYATKGRFSYMKSPPCVLSQGGLSFVDHCINFLPLLLLSSKYLALISCCFLLPMGRLVPSTKITPSLSTLRMYS